MFTKNIAAPNKTKIFASLVGLLLVLLMLMTGITPASATTTVSISPSTQIVSQEQSFTINISIEPDTAIAGAQFNLQFNSSIINVNSVMEGELFKQNGANTLFNPGTIDNVAGVVTHVWGNILNTSGAPKNVSTSGTFAIINITASNTAAGTSPLALIGISPISVLVSDPEGNAVPISVINGTFAIRDITPTPPVISNVAATDITSSSAKTKIIWDTDVAADSLVRYRTESGIYNSVSDSTYVTSHSVDLTELTPSTTYYYVVNSTGQSGNSDQSSEYSFTTLEAPTMPEMHVGDITISSKSIGRGRKYKAIATIPILDSSDKPVDVATVKGHWSGAYSSNTVSGTTSNDGKVTFETKWVKGGGMFTFTVDNVLKEGWTYDESANIETSDSI